MGFEPEGHFGGKPPKMPVGGPAPEWLPGLALALTGAPAGAEGENQGFLTLEELYKTYNEQAERGNSQIFGFTFSRNPGWPKSPQVSPLRSRKRR
jgi:hypothetical protein